MSSILVFHVIIQVITKEVIQIPYITLEMLPTYMRKRLSCQTHTNSTFITGIRFIVNTNRPTFKLTHTSFIWVLNKMIVKQFFNDFKFGHL